MINNQEWDRFYNSGRVEDYLFYCQSKEKSEMSETDRKLKEENAELCNGFRPGFESGTYRGI